MTAAPSTLTQARLIAGLDLKRRLRDRSILIQVFLAPILLALIVGGAFAGENGLTATIVLADADGTDTTAAITGAIATEGDDGVAFAAARVADLGEATALVEEGEADAVVFLPAGLTDAVGSGEAVELVVVGEAGEAVVTGVATSVADGIAARLQTNRVSVSTTTATAAALEANIDEAALGAALQEPAIIQVIDSRLENSFNIMGFFAPGMAMIFLFFVMGAASRSLISERREGTLNRMLAGPTGPTAVLAGKTIGVVVLGLLSLLTVYLVTTVLFGVDWGDPVGVLLVIFSVVLAIAGFSLIITGLARNETQAEALTIIGTLLLAVIGGVFVYTTTGPLATMRAFSPNGQALMAFIELSAGEASWLDILPRVLIILAFGVVTGAIGLLAIRRGMQE